MWSPGPSLRQFLPVCDDPEFLWEVLPVRAWVWVSPSTFSSETVMVLFFFAIKHIKCCGVTIWKKTVIPAFCHWSSGAVMLFARPGNKVCSHQTTQCLLACISRCLGVLLDFLFVGFGLFSLFSISHSRSRWVARNRKRTDPSFTCACPNDMERNQRI